MTGLRRYLSVIRIFYSLLYHTPGNPPDPIPTLFRTIGYRSWLTFCLRTTVESGRQGLLKDRITYSLGSFFFYGLDGRLVTLVLFLTKQQQTPLHNTSLSIDFIFNREPSSYLAMVLFLNFLYRKQTTDRRPPPTFRHSSYSHFRYSVTIIFVLILLNTILYHLVDRLYSQHH